MPRRLSATTAALSVVLLLAAGVAQADTLQRVRDRGEFLLGYRTDAAPFSYRTPLGEAAGYSVQLCREVALAVRAELGLAQLPVKYVPVTAEGRFEAVAGREVDILCGAATITLPRRRVVDFSLPTFIDGASVLFRADGPESFDALDGHEVGVRAGTTTEDALRNTLRDTGVRATMVPVEDHADGLARLEEGAITAYFADRVILVSLLGRSARPEALRLSENYFTYEPHGLAMERGDDDFRLLVDATLARLYRSGAIEDVFRQSFGPGASPSELLLALYLIHSLSE